MKKLMIKLKNIFNKKTDPKNSQHLTEIPISPPNPEELVVNILSVKYIEMHGREVSIDPWENEDLFPHGWYSSLSDSVKAKILTEAITEKKKIVETDLYNSNIEGVRNFYL